MSTPYIGFSNEKLNKLPKVCAGDKVECTTCGAEHELLGTKTKDGKDNDLLLFYKCCGVSYLGAVSGRLIVNVKSDASGKIDLEN